MKVSQKVLPIRSSEKRSYCHIDGLKIGKVAGTDAQGTIFVDFEGKVPGQLAARLTSSAREKLLGGSPIGREVLLGFQDHDAGRPIIIDTLHSSLQEAGPDTGEVERQQVEEILENRKRLVLDAEEEVVIRCGEGSITLTRAGKVLIKGNYVVSRSSGTNSIKGSSVRIN